MAMPNFSCRKFTIIIVVLISIILGLIGYAGEKGGEGGNNSTSHVSWAAGARIKDKSIEFIYGLLAMAAGVGIYIWDKFVFCVLVILHPYSLVLLLLYCVFMFVWMSIDLNSGRLHTKCAAMMSKLSEEEVKHAVESTALVVCCWSIFVALCWPFIRIIEQFSDLSQSNNFLTTVEWLSEKASHIVGKAYLGYIGKSARALTPTPERSADHSPRVGIPPTFPFSTHQQHQK